MKGLDPILYPKTDSNTPLIFILPIQEHFLKESLSVFDHLFCLSWRTHSLNFAREAFPSNMLPTTPGPLHMLSPKSHWASFLYFSTYLSPILQNSVQFSQQNSLFRPNSPITYHVSSSVHLRNSFTIYVEFWFLPIFPIKMQVPWWHGSLSFCPSLFPPGLNTGPWHRTSTQSICGELRDKWRFWWENHGTESLSN